MARFALLEPKMVRPPPSLEAKLLRTQDRLLVVPELQVAVVAAVAGAAPQAAVLLVVQVVDHPPPRRRGHPVLLGPTLLSPLG